jgi:hypothetical protein
MNEEEERGKKQNRVIKKPTNKQTNKEDKLKHP